MFPNWSAVSSTVGSTSVPGKTKAKVKADKFLYLVFIAATFYFIVGFSLVSSPRATSPAKLEPSFLRAKLEPSTLSDQFLEDRKTCVFTISALNNFGFVLDLYDSVMTNSPSIDCFIFFLGDDPEPQGSKAKKGMAEIKEEISLHENLSMVLLSDLEKTFDNFDLNSLAFMYDLVELQTTIKPFAFQYTFQRFGADSAIFLDNDIWVTGSFEELQDELSKYSVVVTPHITSPTPLDEFALSNIDFLPTGIYNFGFVAFSNTASSKIFLDFWAQHLTLYGFLEKTKGMFYDQIWGNFIPSFFEKDDHLVLLDHRYNIAYWNLHERGAGLHMKDGLPHIENPLTKEAEKAIFVHFSGMSNLENYDISKISKYQNRFTIKDFPRLKDVITAYLDRLKSHNTMRYRYIPYGFEEFSNGAKISTFMRRTFASAALEPTFHLKKNLFSPYKLQFSPYLRFWFRQHIAWKNPFCASNECLADLSKHTFFDWMIYANPYSSIDLTGLFFFSQYEKNVWDKRVDLHSIYPEPEGIDKKGFRAWLKTYAVEEKMIDRQIFKALTRALEYNQHHNSKFYKIVNKREDIGVNIYGWHGGNFGLGAIARKLYHSAKLSSLPANAVQAPMIDEVEFLSPAELGVVLTRSLYEAVNIVVMNAPESYIFTKDITGIVREKKYNIGYWNWELEVFPEEWMQFVEEFDEVWVPSRFTEVALKNTPGFEGSVVTVVPIPQATYYDRDDKNNGSSKNEDNSKLPLDLQGKLRGTASKPFVFLVVFDFNNYAQRENPTASIRAFIDAFPQSEDANGEKHLLIMKSHSGTSEQIDELRKVAKFDPRVIFINSLIPDSENRALHQFQDCHVSLHRSEGFGMNILESMGSGVPVIATNYGGNTMFFEDIPNLEDKCTFPVSYELVEIKETVGPYKAGNRWAEVDHNSAVMAMRAAAKFNCKNSGVSKTMIKAVEQVYGHEAIGKKMKNLLQTQSYHRIKEKNRQPEY